ncbi:MAG: protease inhibitor I42 family protein [Blastocatellia bacterium]
MAALTLTQAQNGQSLQVQPGDQIVVLLAENPTTGYCWAVDKLDEQLLTLDDSAYAPAGTALGGGGERKITLTAQNAGNTSVSFKHWREWSGEDSVTDRFGFSVTILP